MLGSQHLSQTFLQCVPVSVRGKGWITGGAGAELLRLSLTLDGRGKGHGYNHECGDERGERLFTQADRENGFELAEGTFRLVMTKFLMAKDW